MGNEQVKKLAALQQISFLTGYLVDEQFVYHGQTYRQGSETANKIFAKLYGDAQSNITEAKYRYFLHLAYSKNWPELESEIDKLS